MSAQPFVFSIRPEYVTKILDGSKVWEFRTRRPRQVYNGDMILIYETAPCSMIVGAAVVDKIVVGEKGWIWRTFQRKGVLLVDFNKYFDRHAYAVAIHLTAVKRISPRPLPPGMGAPQSWSRYKGKWS